MNVVEMRRKLAAKVEEARAILAAADGESRGLNDEETAQYDALKAEMDKLRDNIKRAEELEGYEGPSREARQTPETPAVQTQRKPDTPESAYLRWVRTGDESAMREVQESNRHEARMAVDGDETRASNDTTMNITTAGDGGDLVPVGHYNQIIARLRPLALYNQLGVRMIPGRGTTVNVPVDNEADDGAFVSTNESGDFDRDAPAVTKVAMTLVKYTKKVDLTYELMQDEDSRLMDFLNEYVAQGMAATLNSLLVTEALADGTAALTLDSATAIADTEIPELYYKLKAEYATGNNVAWLMERATEGLIRAKKGDNFQFVPTPAGAPAAGVTSTLWNSPLHTTSYMGSVEASGKSMIIGNWRYMGMRLSPEITVLRDPYSRAAQGEVLFHYYFRCDFEVLQSEAFQYSTHPTA